MQPNVGRHRAGLFKPDNVYVDIKVSNTTGADNMLMRYSQQRSAPIVDNPSDYYLSLVRWKVPGGSFPILVFQVEESQLNPNRGVYTVTLETSTDIVQRSLYFYPSTSVAQQQIPSNVGDVQKQTEYYFVYEFQHFVDMVNSALFSAFDNVVGKPVGAEAPFLIFDVTTGLFGLIAQTANYSVQVDSTPASNPTDPPTYDADIKIYFNNELYNLFRGLASKAFSTLDQGRDYQILVANYGNNYWPNQNSPVLYPSDYLVVWQQYSSTTQSNTI